MTCWTREHLGLPSEEEEAADWVIELALIVDVECHAILGIVGTFLSSRPAIYKTVLWSNEATQLEADSRGRDLLCSNHCFVYSMW